MGRLVIWMTRNATSIESQNLDTIALASYPDM